MILVVFGSRSIDDKDAVYAAISRMREFYTITQIISGGAHGVDLLAERYAREHDIPFKEFTAKWNKHGKAAGPIRNKNMAEFADIGCAIWDGKSRGTFDMINQLEAAEKPYRVFQIDDL